MDFVNNLKLKYPFCTLFPDQGERNLKDPNFGIKWVVLQDYSDWRPGWHGTPKIAKNQSAPPLNCSALLWLPFSHPTPNWWIDSAPKEGNFAASYVQLKTVLIWINKGDLDKSRLHLLIIYLQWIRKTHHPSDTSLNGKNQQSRKQSTRKWHK